MTAYRMTATLEMNGVVSEPLELTLNVVRVRGQTGPKTGGVGSFAVPPGLAGQRFDGSVTTTVTVVDTGETFQIVVTRFDVVSGIAVCKTVGALPFLERQRLWRRA